MQDDEKDGLLKSFIDLKQVLNRIEDLRLIEPNVFLAPFLEVIRTADTTGPLTSLALASVNKFLSYGLIGMYKIIFTSLWVLPSDYEFSLILKI